MSGNKGMSVVCLPCELDELAAPGIAHTDEYFL